MKGLFSKSMKAEWLLAGFDPGAGVAGKACGWPVNASGLSSIPGREPGAETSRAGSQATLGALPQTASLSTLPLPAPPSRSLSLSPREQHDFSSNCLSEKEVCADIQTIISERIFRKILE